ncbi:MAG: neuraminidase-like domain-containing protein [Nitrospira sp.]|nr:neuraminidase-like domain-containing protein [Nitrospira sp.]MDH4354844.1 neuraminidase-like domain-containing protein [Nitrospira sp.]MDH5317082.1 neuraminidase-like domain-containing protein [Nitrospira sp.]
MNKMIFPATLKLRDPATFPTTGKPVGELQNVLMKLRLDVKASDLARKEMGASTVDAVKAFQSRAGLPANGKLTQDTVAKLNAELAHSFVIQSKTRTQRLQSLLQQVGQQVDPQEMKSRKFGASTERAIKAVQASLGVPQNGQITEVLVNRLREEALKKQLGAKTEVAHVHRTLLRALNIAKLKDIRVDAEELKGRKIGPSTQAAIKAVQTKYGLPATGQVDTATYDRLTSIAVSIPEPVRLLKAKTAAELTPLKRNVRLNAKSDHVANVQSTLAFLGYKINEAEFKSKVFGKSTREAVVSYQKARGLAVTGHAAGDTLKSLNQEIQRANPIAQAEQFPYRVRGSVRNELWQGMPGVTVQVWEKLVSGQGAKLAERKTGTNGFYDIPYDPPRDTTTKQVKQPYNLQIKAVDSANVEIGSKLLFNPTQVAWTNFTKGDQPYRGTSEWQERTTAVSKVIGTVKVADLVETAADRQITRAAQAAGLIDEDVMRLVLAHRVATRLNHPQIGPEACYAYIGQNLPSTLPGELIDSTEDWTLIENLVDLAANGLVFMDDDLRTMAFDNAVTLNLMPIAVGLKKITVLAALAQLKQTYALEKPILVGNGSLKGLLESSAVTSAHFPAVAQAFLAHKSFGPEFWSDVSSRPGDFGGADAIKDLKTTVEVGHVTKNFSPMLVALKQKMADPTVRAINTTRDLAKLTHTDWVGLINDNGRQVPPNTDGNTPDEKVKTYAGTLLSQSELMFPATALVATVARGPNNPLPKADAVQTLLDQNPDFDLRTGNLDTYVKRHNITLDEETLTQARVLQRVHRLAPIASAGKVLLDQKIHNSAQIVAMGKDKFLATLTKDEQVDSRTAGTVYGLAEHHYGQVLQRIADYRFDLHRADPKAIINHTYTDAELPPELRSIPNLEILFGSLDYCACAHCQSVYGPAAYLADVLRFLDQHRSEVANKTVKDLLFERRPDIGNIKLNCPNTETPMPYIDLVCEVLENAIAAPNPTPNFNFQTTRTAAELRASPEHVRSEAYDKLRSADFPLNIAFDLWQQQARLFLRHLGVDRWDLMDACQVRRAGTPRTPTDTSIAGEYWGISSHETSIIIATADNTAEKQKIYWGITGAAIPTELSVADFLRRSFLTYHELLDLLSVRWINPPGDANNVVIERPNATCDTERQKLVNVNVNRLDKMHRFLRLRRHVGWEMWELDLLVRASAIGNGTLDGSCLERLKQFAQLQKRLGLATEPTLALFADINTEGRVKPDRPQQSLPSHYEKLFLNQAITNPIDAAFTLPIAAGVSLSAHKSTVLAAFKLNEAEFTLLQPKLSNDNLTVSNLSRIGRYAMLAQGLRLRIKDLLILETLSGTANIFATPTATLEFLDDITWMSSFTFTTDELHYLLTMNPSSPLGLRDDAITQTIEGLRQALRADEGTNSAGVIASQAATTFNVTAEQAHLLLVHTTIGAKNLSQVLQDPELVKLDNAGKFATPVTPTNFPDAYTVFRTLHKSAFLVQRLKLDATNLNWLLGNAAKFKMLQLNTLPIGSAPAASLFPAWLNLVKWVHFKDLYPEPESISLRHVFDLAGVAATPLPEIKTAIAKLTQWEASEVDDLVVVLSLQHSGAASDFANIQNYLRVDKCRRLSKRIGVTVAKLGTWANRDNNAANAQRDASQEVRQAAKSKYDHAVWLEKVTPVEDSLREKKRDALIGYLVANSVVTMPPEIVQGAKRYPNPNYWRDSNDLLKYYLIDVEMSACQLTSRIKQAISSTQMFVQRCLLGLEQPRIEVSRAEQQDGVSENSWNQWKWMKNYRIWEANRKVFLYPENWIEPQLRDDKSPFFKELEGEILQADITDENATAAFLRYVQKVHEVSRLDIVGVYYQLDDTDPRDNLPPDINVLHVVGRTKAQPAIYYYRRFDLNYGDWTAWEKIDLDIQSDQVIPVVYNRRLYLFWLSFIEKPQKVKKLPPAKAAKPSDTSGDSPEPPNQLEIQLCWSAYRANGWAPKTVSHQKLIHPWQRPLYSYNLKPRYKSRENLLWLDVYISQSREFNSTQFWDAYRNTRAYVTAHRPHDETARPWHSSSFIFDGTVIDVKMKALRGQYHVLNSNGTVNEFLSETTSLSYVRDNFGDAGRAIKELGEGGGPVSRRYEIGPRLPLPGGMHYRNTKLVNNTHDMNSSNANVLENSHTRTLLMGAKSPFEIVASQHSIVFDTAAWGPVPFFYQDNSRSFFIKPEWQQVIVGYNQTLQTYNYNFFPFYHPYTALFLRELKRSGLDGLLNRQIQIAPYTYYPGNSFDFNSYSPGAMSIPDKTAKNDRVDFERYGAYALYNWEIFFHAPLMIACKLSENQRFDEAMRWFHYIFDPTNTESPNVPQRYWITRPFFEQNSDAYRQQRIDNLLKNIDQHKDELIAWKNNPFKPHLIARYRPVAYQKTVVMKYIENLIAWADQLFKRDTIESINEATTLYVLAYELLGRRPVKVPHVEHADKSYNELATGGGLDPFGNKQVDILMENFTETPVRVTRSSPGTEPLPTLKVFYFGIPNNDKLLTYWDTVEDRLFKIRHCMNIQGVVRQLPLFEPPIDPALLVKAAAAGIDLGSVIADLAVAPAPYRFRHLAQKAQEFCGNVRSLGDKLLAAIEKFDAEGLSLLRSSQEITLQKAVLEIKRQQISEANTNWAALEKSKELTQQKKEFYESREFMNAWEVTALSLGGVSAIAQTAIAIGYVLAGGLAFVPRFTIGAAGFGGSPEVTADPVDGQRLSTAAEAAVKTLGAIASAADKLSALASTVGSYQRRQDDWDFQGQLATSEIAQIEKQITAAQIRLAIAEKELENQELQIENSQAADEYMRSKYTNQQLYDWQLRQISAIYFQSYQLAYDMAKRAEKCFQLERGEPTITFVQFGYWDSLKKGLLAGDRLANDIQRMEAAYLEQNNRDLEITKHVSLAQFFPLSLLALKEAGACTIVLPEWLFDMDYPGHYFRRIKAISVSIPCIVGPYTSINCTLSLTNHGIRVRKDVAAGYGNPLTAGDDRFFKSVVPQTAIATSHGQNDSGMFELNFNDERFLPFEGAGAVSEWRLELLRENNQFDVASVSDVILQIRYTARPSGDTNLTKAAKDNLAAILPQAGLRLLVLNHEFGGEWHRFFHPDTGQDQVLTFNLGLEHLPFYARGKRNINLAKVELVVEGATGVNYVVKLIPPGGPESDNPLNPDPNYGGHQSMAKSDFVPSALLLGSWQLKIRRDTVADFRSLPIEELKNAYLVLGFKTS